MKKILTITMILAGLILAGNSYAALTDAQISSILSLLTSFGADATTIANVNSSLHGTAPAGTGTATACSFTRNLYLGVSGTDVTCLQNYLIAAGKSIPAGATGLFGPQTQAAVIAWQTANGVSPAAGYFGTVSRAKYASLGGAATGTGTGGFTGTCSLPAGGKEGALTATISAIPASGLEVYTNLTGIAVAGIDLKASASDIAVSRLTVNFSTRPWLYINNLTVTDGTTSRTVPVTQSNVTEVIVGSSYDLLIDGLCYLVPANTTKTLTVKVDSVVNLPSGTAAAGVAVTLTFNANAARGVDGANISEYAPSSAISPRVFTVKAGDTAAIELGASGDNVKARNEVISSTGIATGVVLDKFTLRGKNRNSILRTVEFLVTTNETIASGTGMVSAIYLYDGDTLLSSTSTLIAATSTFSNINLTIPKDTTKTLTIKADVNKTTGNFTEGSTLYATVEPQASSIAAEDANTFAAATLSGSAATGGAGYLYAKAPSLTLISKTDPVRWLVATTTPSSPVTYYGKATMSFVVSIAAVNGDIYVASSTAQDVTATTSVQQLASTTIVEGITSGADSSNGGNWFIPSGSSKTFTFNYSVTREADVGNSYNVYVYMTNLKWATTDIGIATSYNNQTWALQDLYSNGFVLEPVQ